MKLNRTTPRRVGAAAASVAAFSLLPIALAGGRSLATASASSNNGKTKPKTTKTTKTTKATNAGKTSGQTSPAGAMLLTISTSEFLKANVVISVPAGTKAKKITDSTTTVLTFPDGAQMSVQPDASSFADFKKNIVSFEELTKTPVKDRTVFLVDKPDRLVYSDNLGSNPPKRTVFVMQKRLPGLEVNKTLAIGMLCSDTGLQEEAVAPNQASLDAMMAACDSITAAK
jgi:hypothetical protein